MMKTNNLMLRTKKPGSFYVRNAKSFSEIYEIQAEIGYDSDPVADPASLSCD